MSIFSYKDVYVEGGQKILEMNILPEKYCNFDCIYCPLGKSHNKIDIPHSFAEMDVSLTELKSVLVKNEVDLVFINSKGETLINDRVGEVIDLIKGQGLKVRLLSNGYLLGEDEYRELANKCDEVIGGIKTITEIDFQKIQRPIERYTLDEYISNMVSFNKQYKGTFILEITIIKGYNDTEESISKIKNILKDISPGRIIIKRITDEKFQNKLGISDEEFNKISKILLAAY
jgi:wyosine [tRNA(Phe)-imidazoG37] synthetase (radical SAM superfamily)